VLGLGLVWGPVPVLAPVLVPVLVLVLAQVLVLVLGLVLGLGLGLVLHTHQKQQSILSAPMLPRLILLCFSSVYLQYIYKFLAVMGCFHFTLHHLLYSNLFTSQESLFWLPFPLPTPNLFSAGLVKRNGLDVEKP